MRKSLIVKMIAGALTLIVAASCDKNVYDEKRHGDLIHYYSSVDSVDQQHIWMLSQT